MNLQWIVFSCILILVILVLRAALGNKISVGLRYALWGIVLVRLLVPIQLFTVPSADLSVSVSVPEKLQEPSIYVLPVLTMPAEAAPVEFREDGTVIDSNLFGYPRLEDNGETVVRYANRFSPEDVLKTLWFTGCIVILLVILFSNFRFSAKLRRVRKPLEGTDCKIPVYTANGLPSPCLFGVFRPVVYVTADSTENPAMLRHILAHELTHYKHLDHIWSILRSLALAVHWWNPLVWLAVVLSRRDGELACDAGALRYLGQGERVPYGETLLSLVTAKPSPQDLFRCATTMSGEKRSLQERIRRISCEPKQLVGSVIAVLVVASIASACAFSQNESSDHSGWWETAVITVDESGIPCIKYTDSSGDIEKFGNPIPAPAEWAGQDLAGRNQTEVLMYSSDIWAKLVSPDNGWLVACYSRGVGTADTYVYKTTDGGMNWTEALMPGLGSYVDTVDFLSSDSLIIVQRQFNGAPAYLTNDGGETWEQFETSQQAYYAIYPDSNGSQPVMAGDRKDGVYTFLLVGNDMNGSADTIMVASYDTANQTVSVLSILRNTLVSAGSSASRIDYVYRSGGMDALKESVAGLIGFTPDFYVRIEPEMLIDLVDMLGGVEFDVPQEMSYDDPYQDLHIHFSKGVQTLNGEDAVKVLRYRLDTDSQNGYADFGRMDTQRVFLKNLIGKCLNWGNLGKMKAYIDLVQKNIETDLDIDSMVWFTANMLGLNGSSSLRMDNIYTYTLPYEDEPWKSIEGMTVAAADLEQTAELINAKFNPYNQQN